VICLSISPNVKTLGGPVSRGAQAVLQWMIKEILSILSNYISLGLGVLCERLTGTISGSAIQPQLNHSTI
ncbi:MAG: hypothetical protein JSW56_11075, partial [Deltaproteobacteria bacterium]